MDAGSVTTARFLPLLDRRHYIFQDPSRPAGDPLELPDLGRASTNLGA